MMRVCHKSAQSADPETVFAPLLAPSSCMWLFRLGERMVCAAEEHKRVIKQRLLDNIVDRGWVAQGSDPKIDFAPAQACKKITIGTFNNCVGQGKTA